MSHKIAKLARAVLRMSPEKITHEPMLQVSNHRIKEQVIPGIGTVRYETFTLSYAKGSYRQVYQSFKRQLRV